MQLSWRQTYSEAGAMVKLGLVMMLSGLMGNAIAYLTIHLITKQEGIQGVGLYSAAYALSGMFVNFILGAMGADYYPRLAGASNDKAAMNRMVNEQTEIGLLLAVPGLIATMTVAPWVLKIFYTSDFLGATELMRWFIFGCLGRIISWPLAYVMLAMGKSSWMLVAESAINVVHSAFIILGLRNNGLVGVAQAFALLYALYVPLMLLVARHLTTFSWTKRTKATIFLSLITLSSLLAICLLLDHSSSIILGAVTALLATAGSWALIARKIGVHGNSNAGEVPP